MSHSSPEYTHRSQMSHTHPSFHLSSQYEKKNETNKQKPTPQPWPCAEGWGIDESQAAWLRKAQLGYLIHKLSSLIFGSPEKLPNKYSLNQDKGINKWSCVVPRVAAEVLFYFMCCWDRVRCKKLQKNLSWYTVQGCSPSWWRGHGVRNMRSACCVITRKQRKR